MMSLFAFLFMACGGKKEKNKTSPITRVAPKKIDPLKDKGVGPIKSLKLTAIDKKLAEKGKKEFEANCTACHKVDKNYIGPALKGVTERRNPVWIMNMILNPEVMVKKNQLAKELLVKFNGAPMANQNLTEEQARSILEYFRTLK